MKKYLTILFCFLFISIYAQTRDTIYFLVNKKDTLIKKYNPSERKSFKGYDLYFTKKTRIKRNNTPIKEGKVWVPDAKYDYYVYGHNSYTFDYLNNKSKLISRDCLNTLNYIDNRDVFLKTKGLLSDYTIFFIEPKVNGYFIVREMYPVIYE